MKKLLLLCILLLIPISAFGTELTVYSEDAQDGYAYSLGGTFSEARDATTGTFSSTHDQWQNSGAFSMLYVVGRSFFRFDTSAIPDGATISGVSLQVSFATNHNSAPFNTVCAVQGSQGDTLEGVDFDEVGSTSFGTTTGQANTTKTITFNASGIAAISKTGYTYLAIREYDHDFLDVTPTGKNTNEHFFTEETGTQKDPQLIITYSVPSSISGTLEINECTGTTGAYDYALVSATEKTVYAYGTAASDGTYSETVEDTDDEYCGFMFDNLNAMEYSEDWATAITAGDGTFTLTNANWTSGDDVWACVVDPTKTKKTVCESYTANSSHQISDTYQHDGVAESGGLAIGFGFGTTGDLGIMKPIFDFATGD